MSYSYYLSVFLHIIGAAFWIGGMLFLPAVLLPSIRNHPQRTELLYITGKKFRNAGIIALLLLLVTGITNMYTRGLEFSTDFFLHSGYGQKVLIKCALFLLILLINSVHDLYLGKKAVQDVIAQPDPKFRKLAQWSGRLLILISLTMAWLGILISRGG